MEQDRVLAMSECWLRLCVAGGNVVMPRRPATAMDHVIKENVVHPAVIRPKPLPVTGASGTSDQVCCFLVLLITCKTMKSLRTVVLTQ